MWVEYDCSTSFPGSIDNANFELLCHDKVTYWWMSIYIEVIMESNLKSEMKHNLPMYIHDRNKYLFHRARNLFF